MIEQIIIAVCGLSSCFLSQSPDRKLQRYACLFGLFAQPFWLYAAWKGQQWGIMLLAIVYATGWAKGFHTYWMKNE